MDFKTWKRLIGSADPSDRVEAADDIPKERSSQVAQLLLERLKDDEALVRACAADSLRLVPRSRAVRAAVIRFFDSESDLLAKAYAMSTMAEISDISEYDAVLKRWNRSRSKKVRLHGAVGMLKRINSDALDVLLRCASSREEAIRTGAVNALKEVLEVLQLGEKKIAAVMKRRRSRT